MRKEMDNASIAHEHVNGSFELHVISTGDGDRVSFVQAAKVVWPWVDYIHIREKHLSWQNRIYWAESLRSVGVQACRIVINGCELPSQSRTYGGVHWGQEAMRDYNMEAVNNIQQQRLGVSVHSMDEARVAEDRGAHYLFYGHVFATGSKPDAEPRGLDALAEVCSGVSIPVIAIGGIQPENICAIRSSGAKGAAVISNVWTADSPEQAAASLRKAIIDSVRWRG
ncbi:thiamine phosphate synthase [Paenibacillus sp. PCH8]|uniref:thiamine phosphate synthase n=1 Tax=Paenibacillus sp. PCH8 TaxID=2066524 RepID=UPI000CF9F66D|nr:thiamine phosphate synthase [Paenibacillus sp. PCH8]PQP81803.1 thiamine phosphate synthase [Paenibacillus sp. PCH8]